MSDALTRKFNVRMRGTGSGRLALEVGKTSISSLVRSNINNNLKFIDVVRLLKSAYGLDIKTPELILSNAIKQISGVPDESTLRKFRKRLDPAILDKVVACQTRMTTGDSEVTVAIDATGFSTSHASKYYIAGLKYFGTEETVVRGYTKVSLAVCVNTKMIIAADTGCGHNAIEWDR